MLSFHRRIVFSGQLVTKASIFSIYEAANRVESRTPRGHKPNAENRLDFVTV